MGEWILGQKIMGIHDIARHEFFNIVTEEELQPHYQSGRQKPSPEYSEKLSELNELKKQLPILKKSIKESIDPNDIRQAILNERQKRSGRDDETELQYTKDRIKKIERELPHPNPYSWKDYRLPDSEEEVTKIIDSLAYSIFKTVDVVKIIELSKKDKVDPKIIAILEEVHRKKEIEEIYDQLRKKVGISKQNMPANYAQKWKEVALTYFDNNKTRFEFIKREFLEAKETYSLTLDQERRDFFGTILKKIIKDRELGEHSYQRLYELYKKTD